MSKERLELLLAPQNLRSQAPNLEGGLPTSLVLASLGSPRRRMVLAAYEKNKLEIRSNYHFWNEETLLGGWIRDRKWTGRSIRLPFPPGQSPLGPWWVEPHRKPGSPPQASQTMDQGLTDGRQRTNPSLRNFLSQRSYNCLLQICFPHQITVPCSQASCLRCSPCIPSS